MDSCPINLSAPQCRSSGRLCHESLKHLAVKVSLKMSDRIERRYCHLVDSWDVQEQIPPRTLNDDNTLCWRCSEEAGERGHKAEAGAPSPGRDGGREGLSSSHRSALSCFWTAVIPFLALLLKQFSLSSSPCHWKSRWWRVRSELLGVSFLPLSSLQPPP